MVTHIQFGSIPLYAMPLQRHSGYASCTKCKIEGDYICNRICFIEIDTNNLRTDQDFRLKVQEGHHNGTSILENIPNIDMVKCFPLDYMHLVCLGVMKKLLVLWCYGKPSTKLSFHVISKISESLLNLSNHVPLEFNRRPRIKRWKATEFRQFLFYTGPITLKGRLSNERYINFLTLHISITILSCKKHFKDLTYSSDLLKYFVKTFKILYGSEHISHNVHNLLHLTDDVKILAPLDEFSAFPFENYLQSILKTLRKCDRPLAQIIKRHSERVAQNNIQSKSITSKYFPLYEFEHNTGPTLYLNMSVMSSQPNFEETVDSDFSSYTICSKCTNIK
ncbi:hypothetical protein NQ317_018958 [Molorchus minor]|uniref:DUF4218 domain-containing protein n=1 Tax=Molorchus minor TaxID=1323400 RepID=A0ABQ9JK79_9CUCU|nr:hypothetical protein NQ317_018958 [Molorchus minor]